STLARKNSGQKKSGSSGKFVRHKVRRGQNLTVIARHYGVSVWQLRNWNNLGSSAIIYPGQRLKVHVKSSSIGKGDTYTVRSGDSLWKISRRFGVSLVKLKAWNGLNRRARLTPGQVLYLSAAGNKGGKAFVWHTVRRGENLSSIANRYRTTVSRLIRDNDIKNPSRIRAGLRLKIIN
ncbi:MAG: LysM peptidoglycan-binding domain-containing protein, partial [Candidatus Zixiibacteriota bacterium]